MAFSTVLPSQKAFLDNSVKFKQLLQARHVSFKNQKSSYMLKFPQIDPAEAYFEQLPEIFQNLWIALEEQTTSAIGGVDEEDISAFAAWLASECQIRPRAAQHEKPDALSKAKSLRTAPSKDKVIVGS